VADVVLCDLNLPDISGLDVCRAMRQAGIVAPFVMITGFGTMQSALEAGRLGATGFLEKPLDIDEVVAVVEQQLSDRRSRTPALGYEAQMARIAQEIERRYFDPELSVGTVAHLVGLSKQHVCRVIRVRHQRTFGAFVREMRVCEARRLLESSLLTVKEIAFRVGFRSDSRFVRTFRHVTNLSPAEYRRRRT
jgi:YesN/AraC family two-component response regulator